MIIKLSTTHKASSLCNSFLSCFLVSILIPHDFRDGGEVEHGSGCLANVAGAVSEKQQVNDELRVLGQAQSLQGEPDYHVKVPNAQGFVSDVFLHELNKK